MKIKHKEVLIDLDSDLQEIFDITYDNIRQNTLADDAPQAARCLLYSDFLCGVSQARHAFEQEFKSDENFCNLTQFSKFCFLKVLQEAQREAIEKKEYIIAQGISCFSLWVAALALNKIEACKYMEEKIFDLARTEQLLRKSL